MEDVTATGCEEAVTPEDTLEQAAAESNQEDEVVEFVQDTVDDHDKQMTLLVLQCALHEQGQDFVEQRPGTEVTGLVGDLQQTRCVGAGRGRRRWWSSAVGAQVCRCGTWSSEANTR